jgi:nitrate/TMAO reductase-like tetraheme cytochrome c subunit
MMRVLAFVLIVTGCTSAHAPAVDRTNCVGCHTAPVVTDPVPAPCAQKDHTSYATTCYACHGTVAWCPADGKHTAFDLTRPSHAGWDCADCHLAITYDPPVVTDPKQITCTSCHWHDKDRTDPFHVGNSDYSYRPASCLQCHGPGGRR